MRERGRKDEAEKEERRECHGVGNLRTKNRVMVMEGRAEIATVLFRLKYIIFNPLKTS